MLLIFVMKKLNRRCYSLSIALLLCFYPSIVSAQDDAFQSLDLRSLDFGAIDVAVQAEETIEGIALLAEGMKEKPKPFTLSAKIEYLHTNNAFHSDDNKQSDQAITPSVTLGFKLPLSKDFLLLAHGIITTDRYQDNSSLDSDKIKGRIGVATVVQGWKVLVAYDPIIVFETDFDDRTLTLHNTFAAAEKKFDLSKDASISVTLAPAVSRVWADPDDFSQTRIAGSAKFNYQIKKDTKNVLGLWIKPSVSVKWYDDFFESATGKSRNDISVSIAAGFSWTPETWLDLAGSISYTHNDSSLTSRDYSSFDVTPSIMASIKF